MRWLLLLTIVAALAAGCGREPSFTDAEVADASAFYRAVDASNAATRLTNRYTTTGAVPSEDDLDAIRVHVRLALEAVRATRDGILDRMHPELKDMYRTEFEGGLALVDRALSDRDARMLADGYWRVERWLDWLEANADEIRFPPRAQEP